MNYTTDEAIAAIIRGDFAKLCPRSAVLAGGADGTLAISDRWLFGSITQDFATQGLAAGHVISLIHADLLHDDDPMFAVSSVETSLTLRLRNVGMGTDQGLPPGPAGGLADIEFEARTMDAMIRIASSRLDTIFGISADMPYTLIRDLSLICSYMVIVLAYTSAMRGTVSSQSEYGEKAKAYQMILDRMIDASRERIPEPEGPRGTFRARVER